jgi:hypothetical protein
MVLTALLVLGAIQSVSASPSASASSTFQNLTPGRLLDAHQDLPVTIVLVGYHATTGATAVDPARLLAPQLKSARPVDRTTRFYEQVGAYQRFLEPSALGLTYDYRYNVVSASQPFEDGLFAYLASTAFGPLPPTVFQQAYSAHPFAAQQVSSNFVIDANLAEQWMADHAGPMLGIDTTRPTVFFLNWFGRPDFRFHTYGFLSTRPGHDHPVGATQLGQMVAFGGSTTDAPYGTIDRLARVWFYDLSAGPDYSTASWLLDQADFNGDGVTDERIPPIWEYGTSHWYRPFDDLTADLAKIVRFVAVDEFFGPSPIYDPAISEPLLATKVELDLNLFAGVAGHDPRSTLRIADLPRSLSLLDPTRVYATDVSVQPLSGDVAEAYDCQQSFWTANPKSCYGDRTHLGPLDAFYDLDVYFGDHLNQYLDGVRYEVPVAVFDVPDSRLNPNGIRGLASSKPPNIQSWTYAWLTDSERSFGYDDTATVLHEVGHHLGLSHVHDGFDVGLDQDVSVAMGRFFFMAVGDEANTAMSYIPNTTEFGQFDRDNMARWELAARLDNANRILGNVVRSPNAWRAGAAMSAADDMAGEALADLAAWDLLGASRAAADAYALVLTAAAQAGVKVESFSGVADQGRGAGVIAAASDRLDLRMPKPSEAAGRLEF